MKRLLAISWEMPPLSGPRAVQVARTLQHLVPLGWASTVVCFGPRSTRYNQDYVVDFAGASRGAIEVVRVASPEEWLLFRALWRLCPPLKRLPDEKWVWIPRAASEARRQLASGRFSAIVSFGQPWSDHLVGLRLSREFRLPWVAHFSDPWVDSPYLRGWAWQRGIWSRMERAVVQEASRLVFQNEQTATRTLNRYAPEFRGKAVVIPQGFEATIDVAPPSRPRGPLRVVYTGRFYPGVRTPGTVLVALARLSATRPLAGRLNVEFLGARSGEYRRKARELGLDTVVTFHGRVPPSSAANAARQADALLVIDAPSDGPSLFLPSKLVDYLPFGKPIVGVTPVEGASADLLRALGYPIVDPVDVDGIARVFADLVDRWEGGTLQASPSHHGVARGFDIRETTRRFAEVLDGVATATAGAA